MGQTNNYLGEIKMSKMLKQFLSENKNRHIRLFLANGYQLKGTLIDFDEVYIKMSTNEYSSAPEEILVAINSVTTLLKA